MVSGDDEALAGNRYSIDQDPVEGVVIHRNRNCDRIAPLGFYLIHEDPAVFRLLRGDVTGICDLHRYGMRPCDHKALPLNGGAVHGNGVDDVILVIRIDPYIHTNKRRRNDRHIRFTG